MTEQQPSGNKVLVVAGEAATRSFIRRTLESVLLDVETVSRAENAILKIRSGEIGFVVIDPELPTGRGVELLEDLERESPALALRTVLVSDPGNPDLERLSSYSRRIDRPVVRNQLILAISDCLRQTSTDK